MREIKFRGKRADTGEWVYGDLLTHETRATKGIVIRDWAHKSQYFDIEPETVGQYTWLKDENSKEIYEGDILLHVGSGDCSCYSNPYGGPHRSYKGEKVYVKGMGCGFIARHISNFGNPSEDIPNAIINGWDIIRNYELWNLQRWFVKIGNIYDNPELLEG